MAIDLKSLSPSQLQALISNAESQMHEARANHIQDVRKKIDALLGNSGLTLADVYPTRGRAGKGTGKRSSVAPKYRNPENPAETWSGRGRQPLWLAHALKRRGTSIDSFLIEGATKAKAPAKKTRVAKKATKATRKKAKR